MLRAPDEFDAEMCIPTAWALRAGGDAGRQEEDLHRNPAVSSALYHLSTWYRSLRPALNWLAPADPECLETTQIQGENVLNPRVFRQYDRCGISKIHGGVVVFRDER